MGTSDAAVIRLRTPGWADAMVHAWETLVGCKLRSEQATTAFASTYGGLKAG